METVHKGSELGIIEIFRRERGFSDPRTFARRISAAEAIVKQIDLYGKLKGHNGCVNTIQFNSSGDLLVSGSDDQKIMFWNWATKTLEFLYPSGHLDNIFQVKIMPFTDDRKVVTSSADGQVRLGQVLDNGKVKTKKLGEHQGRVHSLAVEPGSPYVFYSCGEDGFVQHFDLRSNSPRKLFSCSSFADTKQSPRIISLNAIVIDPRNPNYFAIGGSDEFARVYDVRKYLSDCSGNLDAPVNTFCPHHLIETKTVHITSLAYSNTSELLVSYNDELIYLFQKNMGIGPYPLSIPHEDLQQLEEPQAYSGHRNLKTVKGVSFFGPRDEYVMSGSDCGHIFIWKKKGAKLLRVMVGDRRIVNQLEPHPHMPVIATSGLEKNIKLWAPLSNDVLPLPRNIQEIMESNRQGRENNSPVTLTPELIMHVLQLHRRRAMAHNERRHNRSDSESDEGGDEAYVLGLSGDDENSSECNIS
ncbi:DDB1- and CUL4-associated factor like [Actinidia chinensis var. chinensis]|uniref:DDB1-and CUL4-associated factor like n=1 Tax=Actinidia chinensis var. chinensis TaxID=1590841 RepID=A0A2R6P828_ACTCC|nr:DDB1- and CUL4-associated factor like [Actinidia chinensis var. chinensis]